MSAESIVANSPACASMMRENTIKTHVGRVLSKLGLRDRVQVVVLAHETGPVTPGPPDVT